MEMTKELIKKELDKLIGREVEAWSPYCIYETIKRILQENNYPVEHLSWTSQRQEATFLWRGYIFCYVSYKKKMGKKKDHYWETQKYNYKEFNLSIPYEVETLNEAIVKATETYETNMKIKAEKLKRDIEAFKLLKEHFKIEKDWDVRRLVESIDNNYYNITKILEGKEEE